MTATSLVLPIYLDNHSTTRPAPEVIEAMMPYFTLKFGNPASHSHSFGWDALKTVNKSREAIASLINAEPKEIIFTSGATESNNLALKGIATSYVKKGKHIIITEAEHKSILITARRLEQYGFTITCLPVDKYGMVRVNDIKNAIRNDTILVSTIFANNEVGTVNPIAEIGQLLKGRNIFFHTDATQAVGKIPVDVKALGIHLLSMSAHKIYGPKGIGALYILRSSPTVRLLPIIDGGGHERGLRSGTLNVPAISGFAKACELCQKLMPEESMRIFKLRQRLFTQITQALDGVYLNGHLKKRLPGNLNISFEGVDGESLITQLIDIAVSSGAACTSASPEPSHVLKAMKVPENLINSSIRFGIGRYNTREEVDYASKKVVDIVTMLRKSSA